MNSELAPVVCKKVTKKKALWRNEAIKEMTRLKTKLRNKYWNTRDVNDWVAYKNIRNDLNREVWKAKKSYFADRLSNCKDPKEFWRTLKQGGVTSGKGNNNMPPDVDINELISILPTWDRPKILMKMNWNISEHIEWMESGMG